jgi:hypothetical protein
MALMTADDFNECGAHELRYFLGKQQVRQGDRRKATMVPIAVSLGLDRAAWDAFWENAHDYIPWQKEKQRTTLPPRTEIEDQKGDESEDRSDWETVSEENTETAVQDDETAFRRDSEMADQDNKNVWSDTLRINQDNETVYRGDETVCQGDGIMFPHDGTMFEGDAPTRQGDATMFLDDGTVFPSYETMFPEEETIPSGDKLMSQGETMFQDYNAPDYHSDKAMNHPSPPLHTTVYTRKDLSTVSNDISTVTSSQPHQPHQALPHQFQVRQPKSLQPLQRQLTQPHPPQNQANQPQTPQPSTPSIPDALKMRILARHTEWKSMSLDYDNPDTSEALESELWDLEREARGVDKGEYKEFKWEAGGYGQDWPFHSDPD